MLRGTIYLGVSSPLLRGQHQYPNTQYQDTQHPVIHYPNTQCPHTHYPTTNAQTLTSPASCAFFIESMLWKEPQALERRLSFLT